jgi:two-component system CheB/CheR fusion protein
MAEAAATNLQTSAFPVVAVGASAGGITALRSLLQAMPGHPNLAVVVLLHQPPDRLSHLAELLGKWAAMPVREAADGVRLVPDHLYVALPGHALTLEQGVFVTHPRAEQGLRPGLDTIDTFFESLALDLGTRAIGVVLSGTGTDGTAGVVRIKQAGGMVLVQDPASALHDGMPKAAIATGAADRVLPPDALARELVACAAPGYARPSPTFWTDEASRDLDGILELIRTRAGLDLRSYQTAPLLWRIQRRMEARRVTALHDYKALLHDAPAELEALIRAIPIHVTAFFRDGEAWDVLQRDVIAPLAHEHAGSTPIRAWTPACASGEEAYSLAMLLAEQASTMTKPLDFQVFATDAAAEKVARAGHGIFPAKAVEAVAPERRERFFYAADGSYRVRRALREKMVFAPQDLLADPPFTGLDLVTCRNLLIYLEPEVAKRVILSSSSMRHCARAGSSSWARARPSRRGSAASRWSRRPGASTARRARSRRPRATSPSALRRSPHRRPARPSSRWARIARRWRRSPGRPCSSTAPSRSFGFTATSGVSCACHPGSRH